MCCRALSRTKVPDADFDVSGLPCLDNSKAKKHRMYYEGPTGVLFIIWALRYRRTPSLKLGILENTPDSWLVLSSSASKWLSQGLSSWVAVLPNVEFVVFEAIVLLVMLPQLAKGPSACSNTVLAWRYHGHLPTIRWLGGPRLLRNCKIPHLHNTCKKGHIPFAVCSLTVWTHCFGNTTGTQFNHTQPALSAIAFSNCCVFERLRFNPTLLYSIVTSKISDLISTKPRDYVNASQLEVNWEAIDTCRVRGICFRPGAQDLTYILSENEYLDFAQVCKLKPFNMCKIYVVVCP